MAPFRTTWLRKCTGSGVAIGTIAQRNSKLLILIPANKDGVGANLLPHQISGLSFGSMSSSAPGTPNFISSGPIMSLASVPRIVSFYSMAVILTPQSALPYKMNDQPMRVSTLRMLFALTTLHNGDMNSLNERGVKCRKALRTLP